VVKVRDWATFGLARQTDRDLPALRDALAARLADDDPETRAEAVHGLAVRADERAIEPLLRRLEAAPGPADVEFVLTEALYALAAATADPRLHPHLLADRATWGPDDLPPALAAALARYQAPD
jgi:HEAT repeat protein